MEIRERCSRLNEKKVALDIVAKAISDTVRLELLQQELKSLDDRVPVTKQLIEDEKTSLANSRREVQNLTSQLKVKLDVLNTLNRQIIGGDDREDEAVIAETHRVRVDAIAAIEDFLL